MPRKGILIRLCIYVPIILFLSWRAWQKWSEERAVAAQAAEDPLEQRLAPHKKTITLPDGSEQTIYEMTESEAEEILGPMAKPASMSKGEAPGETKTASPPESKPSEPASAPAKAP